MTKNRKANAFRFFCGQHPRVASLALRAIHLLAIS